MRHQRSRGRDHRLLAAALSRLRSVHRATREPSNMRSLTGADDGGCIHTTCSTIHLVCSSHDTSHTAYNVVCYINSLIHCRVNLPICYPHQSMSFANVAELIAACCSAIGKPNAGVGLRALVSARAPYLTGQAHDRGHDKLALSRGPERRPPAPPGYYMYRHALQNITRSFPAVDCFVLVRPKCEKDAYRGRIGMACREMKDDGSHQSQLIQSFPGSYCKFSSPHLSSA